MLVQRRPFEDHRQRSWRQIAFYYCNWLQGDECPAPAIRGVQMRWPMIIEEHTNNNPKEPADFRHYKAPAALIYRQPAAGVS